jgi:hypothetical protein
MLPVISALCPSHRCPLARTKRPPPAWPMGVVDSGEVRG